MPHRISTSGSVTARPPAPHPRPSPLPPKCSEQRVGAAESSEGGESWTKLRTCWRFLTARLLPLVFQSQTVGHGEQQLHVQDALQHDPLQQGAVHGEDPQQDLGPLPAEEVQQVREVHHVSVEAEEEEQEEVPSRQRLGGLLQPQADC